jgi:hypothetical protein
MTTTINANATPTFAIFVQGNGTVPFDPATNRIFVRFKDSGDVTRGSTSGADAVTTCANFLMTILIASIQKRTHRGGAEGRGVKSS